MTISPIYDSQNALNQALSLASQGIPVFACKYDKKPITDNGFYDSTTDANVLRAQFAAASAVCVGLPTGSKSGYAVLDVDFKNGAAEWWEKNKALLDSSFAYSTPSGGYHIYFRNELGLQCSNSKIAPGIDIKAEGGYVVYHPANGFPRVGAQTSIAVFPSCLVEPNSRTKPVTKKKRRKVPDAYANAALAGALEDVTNAHEGERNDTLNKAAYSLFGLANDNLQPSHVSEVLKLAAQQSGLGVREVERTIKSAIEKYDLTQTISNPSNPEFFFTRADQLKQVKLEYLVTSILSVGSQSCWFGKSGSLKTFGALSIGLCVASGTPWYGHAVKQGTVLYICGEGKHGINKRLRAWEVENQVPLLNILFYVSSGTADFSDETSLQHIESAIAATGETPVLIIVDTLNRNTSQDEDKSENMARIVKASDTLKDKYGAAILWVHHTGHSEQERPRGSSALTASMDHVFRFDRDKQGNKLSMVCTKNKDAEELTPLRFCLKQVPVSADDILETGIVLVKDDAPTLTSIQLSPQQHHALYVLRECLDSMGVERKIDDHGNQLSVTEKEFEQKIIEARVVDSNKPESIRRAMDRWFEQLTPKDYLAEANGFVWLGKTAGQLWDNEKTRAGQSQTVIAVSGQTRQTPLGVVPMSQKLTIDNDGVAV